MRALPFDLCGHAPAKERDMKDFPAIAEDLHKGMEALAAASPGMMTAFSALMSETAGKKAQPSASRPKS